MGDGDSARRLSGLLEQRQAMNTLLRERRTVSRATPRAASPRIQEESRDSEVSLPAEKKVVETQL